MMSRAGGGSIIGMSSGAGAFPHRWLWAYGAAKAGIDMFCRSAADELGADGIRVNSVQPGIVDDELMSFITAGGPLLDDYIEGMPLGRVGHGRRHRRGGALPGRARVVVDHRRQPAHRRRPPPPQRRQLLAAVRLID